MRLDLVKAQHQTELKHISINTDLPQLQQLSNYKKPEKQTILKSGLSHVIFKFLRHHYHRQKSDPLYILNDFKQIANYYSNFPEVVSLLDSLRNKNWKLI